MRVVTPPFWTSHELKLMGSLVLVELNRIRRQTLPEMVTEAPTLLQPGSLAAGGVEEVEGLRCSVVVKLMASNSLDATGTEAPLWKGRLAEVR